MSVIVTGASGFIGTAITRALAERGTPVISVGRTDPGIENVRHIEWDIRHPAPVDVTRLGNGATAVVHCAADVRVWAPEDALQATNVQGTRHVLDAFPKARIVHLSSTDVYDPFTVHASVYEEAGPLDPGHYPSPYERAEALAEGVVHRVRPDALVLRPRMVYGPGESRWTEEITSHVKKGRIRLPLRGRARMTLTHVDNVVAAVLAGLDHSEVRGPVNVGDPEPYVFHEALNTFLARTGQDVIAFEPLASDLALLAAWRAERRVRRKGARPTLTRYVVRHLVRDRTYNLGRLRDLLGVTPVQGLEPVPEDRFAAEHGDTQRIEFS
ncbi:NAD-dependent epimerase/dehydratase family protein [Brevibacterium litoralis]|uniref:NAD-dependent epimerase/dehydratase family protein n=1 Tax=Brevibacterium litoralis TaxID=3138935 RepID=UPI0032ED9BF5